MYRVTHEGEPPTGDLHPHTHAHAGRTPPHSRDRLHDGLLRRLVVSIRRWFLRAAAVFAPAARDAVRSASLPAFLYVSLFLS